MDFYKRCKLLAAANIFILGLSIYFIFHVHDLVSLFALGFNIVVQVRSIPSTLILLRAKRYPPDTVYFWA